MKEKNGKSFTVKALRKNEEEKYNVYAQMSRGVAQLHEIGYAHRDCKPDNFLFKYDVNYKIEKVLITDFGLSGLIDDSMQGKVFLPILEPDSPFKNFPYLLRCLPVGNFIFDD